MRWKTLLWAVCPLPALTGCGTTFGAADTVANEVDSSHARRGIERDPRRDAQGGWQTVVARYPGQAFTDEFRDGFLDGYVDCRTRGGASQPPTVPPPQYGRDKKYLTPEGQSLVRDYYLGFKYGIEVAALAAPHPATDWADTPVAHAAQGALVRYGKPNSDPPAPRPSYELTVWNKYGAPKKSDDPAPADARLAAAREPGAARPISPLPKPELPVIEPFNPDLAGGKFSTLPVAPNPDLLPVPNPPLPLSVRPAALTTGGGDSPDEAPAPSSNSLPLILRNIPVSPFRPPPTPDESPSGN